MKDCNHICMFGKNSLIDDLPAHVNSLHSSQALFFRLKVYSPPYHDFLLSKRRSESTLPAGCVELFCNHLHVTKDRSHLPVVVTLLHHLQPVRLAQSPKADPSPAEKKHNDFFLQCGVTDFSLSYSVSSLDNPFPSPSQHLVLSLKQFSAIFYNNYFCPCCPQDAGECVVSLGTEDFSLSIGRSKETS